VKRLAGKPFVLLSVNNDEDRQEARAIMEREGMTWRSWWEGSIDGPIQTEWEVPHWPWIFLIDHKGLVRYEGVRGIFLDQAIDLLLKEVEEGK
jgi:hypothetical protein